MKRLCAVLIAAVGLVGCRSSQQPTNPFLRTTVPPPGTGEAAVVVPGDPYYPGAPVAQPAPVAPVQPAPQQVVPQTPDLKKAVPGGNYMYHQSSVDEQGDVERLADGQWEDVSAASPDGTNLAINAAAPNAIRLGGPSDAVAHALALAKEPNPVETAHFTDHGGLLPGETSIGNQPPAVATSAGAQARSPQGAGNQIRVVDSPDADTPQAGDLTPEPDASSNVEASLGGTVA